MYHQNQNRLTKIVSAVVLTAAFFSPAAYADQYSDQIAALNSQIQQQQSAAANLQNQANTLSNQVAALNDQEEAMDAQLEVNQDKQAQTTNEITAAQAELVTKKGILDDNVREIYQESQVTPLEMLASSENFSDFVDKQQYLDEIKDHIQDEYNQVSQLETSLESQQASLTRLVTQQSSMVSALATEKAQQNQILAQTQGQESAYQQLVASNQSKLNSVIAARAAALRSSSSGLSLESGGGGCGDYPNAWCQAAQDSLITDGNYYNRECVSYAAYYREKNGYGLPANYGNAYQWAAYVNSHTPQAGDVAVWGINANAYVGSEGHVAIVQSVDGSGITISQYNFDVGNGPGLYSEMHIDYGSTMWGGIGFIQ
jgi:peptidoglycan hydrolase CwlO-like protein/surface antigen